MIDFECASMNWDNGDCVAGDDDDAATDPCSPSTAQFNCAAAGVSVGSSAWAADVYSLAVDDCGDYFGGEFQTFEVPPGVNSLYMGWRTTSGDPLIHYVVNEGGNVLVNSGGPVNEFGAPGSSVWGMDGVAGLVFPQTPTTDLSTGCLGVWPLRVDGSGGGDLLLTYSTGPAEGLVYLDVAIVDGAGVEMEDVEAALYYAADIYYNGTGEATDLYEAWDLYTISDSSFANIPSGGSQIDALRAVPLGSNPRTVKVFIINAFDDGPLGIAGGIPGPLGHQGLPTSAVVLAAGPHFYDGFDSEYFGTTLAHEIGHFLGLFHTSESTGSNWDPLPDTPECTSPSSPSNCGDGTNLMFWTGGPNDPQTSISAEQANVIDNSPIKR